MWLHSHILTQWGSVTPPDYSKHPVSSLSPSLHQMLWCASVLGQKSPWAQSLSAGPAAPCFRLVRSAQDEKLGGITLSEREGELVNMGKVLRGRKKNRWGVNFVISMKPPFSWASWIINSWTYSCFIMQLQNKVVTETLLNIVLTQFTTCFWMT